MATAIFMACIMDAETPIARPAGLRTAPPGVEWKPDNGAACSATTPRKPRQEPMMDYAVGIVQPKYPASGSPDDALSAMADMLRWIEEYEGRTDLIVLPEYANCPGLEGRAAVRTFVAEQSDAFLSQLSELAARRKTNIAVNGVLRRGECCFNTTRWIGRDGRRKAEYDKTHLTAAERDELGLTAGATPVVFEHEGLRIGFVTCFEIYFAEYLERIASLRPDLLVFPTYQRSEQSEVIRRQAAGRALDVEAFVLRSSYAKGQGSPTGGCSLIADPSGSLLLDAGQEAGLLVATIDPTQKRERPAAHSRQAMRSRQVVQDNRRPELYRPAGPTVDRKDRAALPHVVAHRGLSGVCPENTLPSFGAAVALGVEEIEFDVWDSIDGVCVICHDPTVDRTSDGAGRIDELNWEQIRRLDAGAWKGEQWRGLRFPRLEEVFERFAGRVMMNIHAKTPGRDGCIVRRIRDLAEYHGVTEQIYIAGEGDVLKAAREIAPAVSRCCLEGHHDGRIVDAAVEYGCRRLQFHRKHYDQTMAAAARHRGIVCNLFWADTPQDAAAALANGIDAVLTNRAHSVLPAVRSGR